MIYHTREDREDWNTLNDLETVVRRTTKNLRKHQDRFDSIVVTGLSGITVGLPVSMRLKKPLVILRKPNDDSHGRQLVNMKNIGERTIWLDDFVASGDTRSRVRAELADAVPAVEVVGEYLYAGYSRHDYTPTLSLAGRKLGPLAHSRRVFRWVGRSSTCSALNCLIRRSVSESVRSARMSVLSPSAQMMRIRAPVPSGMMSPDRLETRTVLTGI